MYEWHETKYEFHVGNRAFLSTQKLNFCVGLCL